MGTLIERFEAFIKTRRGFENIDELLRQRHIEGKRRADYLAWDRRVIVEQKVLVMDPADKPQRFVEDLIKQRGILIYGRVSMEHVLARLPDGKELKRQFIRGLTKGVEDSFAAADRQTRDTREIFSIPDAVGIVVVLNASAPTLHLDLVRYGLSQVLQKRTENGGIRYPNNDGLILISEAHTEASERGGASPCFASPTPHTRSEETVREFSTALVKAWADFNKVPLLR